MLATTRVVSQSVKSLSGCPARDSSVTFSSKATSV